MFNANLSAFGPNSLWPDYYCRLVQFPVYSIKNTFIHFIYFSAVYALLGETVKWIPMSPQRISYVNLHNDGTLDLNFTRVTNQVMPQIVYILKGRLWSRDCLLDPSDASPSCRLWEPSGFIPRNGATTFSLILCYLILGACLTAKYCACV